MLITIIRTIILYGILMFTIRLMGKQQVGQLQPYEFVIALMIADLATVPIGDPSTPIYKGLFPIITIFLLHSLLSYFSLKNQRFAKCISGSPSIVIKNGEIQVDALTHCGYTLNELLEQLRIDGYPDLNKVAYTIIENNGDLSVILKSQYQPVTAKDLNLPLSEVHYPTTLIIDGVIQRENMQCINFSEKQLSINLKKHGYSNPQQILLAMLDSTGHFFVQEKGER